jgi:hypothetical protein
MALIVERQFDFALLDYNLGDETSVAVANALVAKGVRFAFATGYGEAPEILGSPHPIAVVRKPYNAAALAEVVLLMGSSDAPLR